MPTPQTVTETLSQFLNVKILYKKKIMKMSKLTYMIYGDLKKITW